jgi:hypothetical protein
MLKQRSDYYPLVLVEDRYAGTYSGGLWLAVARASELVENTNTRAQFCLTGDDGPSGGDIEAASFWRDPPHWISTGATPDEALKTLSDRLQPAS